MKTETVSRQENQNKRRLKAAGFPYLKTMDEFDCSQLNEAVSPLFLNELASCQFIRQRQNVVMIGNPGRGKTHLSIALGLKACSQGFNVLFKNAATLSTEQFSVGVMTLPAFHHPQTKIYDSIRCNALSPAGAVDKQLSAADGTRYNFRCQDKADAAVVVFSIVQDADHICPTPCRMACPHRFGFIALVFPGAISVLGIV